ncbi:MAG: biotin/lipoyl-containing protein, partial [Proteiniphilum sp.]
IALAKQQGRTFYTGDPQELYPDQLDEFRAEMQKKNWDTGRDDEELFELAMHPEQYRAYKSGDAKRSFEADLAKRKAEKVTPAAPAAPAVAETTNGTGYQPKTLMITIDNEEYVVNISYPDAGNNGSEPAKTPVSVQQKETAAAVQKPAASVTASKGSPKEVVSPLEGKFFLTKDSSETPLKVGDTVKKDDIIGYIESMKTYNAVAAEEGGTVTEICFANGDLVDEDDVLIKMQ